MNQTKVTAMDDSVLLAEPEIIPYPIPAKWKWTTLGSVVDINPPKHVPKDLSDDALVSFVPMSAVSEVTGTIESIQTRPYSESKSGYTSFLEGDVLFAKITPCMENGKTAIAENLLNGFGYGSTEFYVLRCKPLVSRRYVYHLLRSETFRKQAKSNMTGAVGQQRVPKAFLADFPFPLPPFDEQNRIVERIESLLGKIEEAKSDILYARETFSSRRASILSKAFCGELTDEWRVVNPNTETGDCLAQRLMQAKKLSASNYDCEGPFDIPGTWKWMRFGDIFHVQVGSTPSRKVDEYWGEDNLWVSSGEVAFTRISDTKEKVTDKGVVESRLKLAPERSVLFAMIGEGKTRGQVAIAEKPVYHNQNVASIWVKEVDSEYVYYWLLSQYLNNRAIGSGNNQPAYNKSRVEDLLIPLPPAGEQHEVVRVINSFLTLEDKVVELLEMDNNIQTMQTSILSKAFSGGL
ncbi:hypothetical protein D2Q93_05425 [Alicyclobacillaceae bacterium I2511]|nr:hypothetical protein D2Q93_05425 [Alicyclobacillaceae bacterium I2511]